MLNILCKVTGNGLRATRLLDDDSQDLVDTLSRFKSKRLNEVIRAQGGHIEHRLGLMRHTRIVIKLCGILQN